MAERNDKPFVFPAGTSPAGDLLTAKLREGAQKMLASAIEAEVAEYLAARTHLTDAAGRRCVVRNGHLPTRSILTGVGAIEVTAPRVHDRRPPESREKFTSKLLPPYLRKAKSIEELIPWLYLKGISTGDMSEALVALVGADAAGNGQGPFPHCPPSALPLTFLHASTSPPTCHRRRSPHQLANRNPRRPA